MHVKPVPLGIIHVLPQDRNDKPAAPWTMNDHPLVRRLRNFAPLSPEEETRLCTLGEGHLSTRQARRDLIREGERPRVVYLILSGWASRHKTLEDGRRQLLQFMLPGDLCDVHNAVLGEMDHSIGAVTDLRYAEIPHGLIEEAERDFPAIRRAFWWHSLTDIATQREWTTNIGQRSAFERLAHLFCELFLRLRAVGLTDGMSCDMPVTQVDLGGATGLTSVHVNRTLQDLRQSGLIVLERRRLTIPDLAALQRSALFSPDYLHLGRQRAARPTADPRGVGPT